MHTHIQYAYACAYTYVFVFADLKKSSSRIKKLVNDLRRGARQGLGGAGGGRIARARMCALGLPDVQNVRFFC